MKKTYTMPLLQVNIISENDILLASDTIVDVGGLWDQSVDD